MIKEHDGLYSLERRDRIACECSIKGIRPEVKKCPSSFQEAISTAEHKDVFLSSIGIKSRVNAITDDVMATIQRFNKVHVKRNEEIWKAIQDLTKAVENVTAQTNNHMKHATHESVGAPQSRYQRARRAIDEPVMCCRCNQPGHLQRACPSAVQKRSQSQNAKQSD